MFFDAHIQTFEKCILKTNYFIIFMRPDYFFSTGHYCLQYKRLALKGSIA